MPQMFQSNWTPQVMPMTNLVLPNTFNNFNLSSLPPLPLDDLPPQQSPNPMNVPPQQNSMMNQPLMGNSNVAMEMMNMNF